MPQDVVIVLYMEAVTEDNEGTFRIAGWQLAQMQLPIPPNQGADEFIAYLEKEGLTVKPEQEGKLARHIPGHQIYRVLYPVGGVEAQA